MNSHLLFLCLCSNAILCLLENLGFQFRVAGFRTGNTVTAYSLQHTLSFISRIFSFFLVPVISWMADSRMVVIDLKLIIFYYLLLSIAILSSIKIEDKILSIFSKIIDKVNAKGSLLILRPFQLIGCFRLAFSCFKLVINRIFTNTKLFEESKNALLNKKDRFKIDMFSLTYIPYYAAWVLVCILITRFPEKPAFCISMVTFFTFLSSIYQSLIFEPYVSSLAKNPDKSIQVYSRLQEKKFHSIICSFILSSILYATLIQA